MTYLAPKECYPEEFVFSILTVVSAIGVLLTAILFLFKRTKFRGAVCIFLMLAAFLIHIPAKEWGKKQKAKNYCDSYSFGIRLFISDNGRWPASLEEMYQYVPVDASGTWKLRYFAPSKDSAGSFVVLACDLSQPPYEMTLDHFKFYHGDIGLKK